MFDTYLTLLQRGFIPVRVPISSQGGGGYRLVRFPQSVYGTRQPESVAFQTVYYPTRPQPQPPQFFQPEIAVAPARRIRQETVTPMVDNQLWQRQKSYTPTFTPHTYNSYTPTFVNPSDFREANAEWQQTCSTIY